MTQQPDCQLDLSLSNAAGLRVIGAPPNPPTAALGVSGLLPRETLLLHANLDARWRSTCPKQIAAESNQNVGEDHLLFVNNL